ncbi:amidohydrolase family protein [Planctomycetes bacterium CA13]
MRMGWIVVITLNSLIASAQEPSLVDPATLDGRDGHELLLRNFCPKSQLKTESHRIGNAKSPCVDVHTHLHYKLHGNKKALNDFVGLMDRNNIAVCVSLDGKLGDQLIEHRNNLWDLYRDRFVVFAHIDWKGSGTDEDPSTWACHENGFAERTADKIREAAVGGISGLKIFKRFGLGYRNPDGSLMEIDDPRWDPIWSACGELGIPVLIHTADPAAFFERVDESNERWEELNRHPDWSFYGDGFPSRESLLAARNRVIARHPNTNFIGAHLANSSEDLKTVGQWLDRYPNLYVDSASRISELGRQPYTSHQFYVRYSDRVLFGTDGPWPEQRLRYYWRFFETKDESFPYSEKVPPPQGMWAITGIKLPDEVLENLYWKNAAKLIPGVSERVEKYRKREK